MCRLHMGVVPEVATLRWLLGLGPGTSGEAW
jgi:hypothetical protein